MLVLVLVQVQVLVLAVSAESTCQALPLSRKPNEHTTNGRLRSTPDDLLLSLGRMPSATVRSAISPTKSTHGARFMQTLFGARMPARFTHAAAGVKQVLEPVACLSDVRSLTVAIVNHATPLKDCNACNHIQCANPGCDRQYKYCARCLAPKVTWNLEAEHAAAQQCVAAGREGFAELNKMARVLAHPGNHGALERVGKWIADDKRMREGTRAFNRGLHVNCWTGFGPEPPPQPPTFPQSTPGETAANPVMFEGDGSDADDQQGGAPDAQQGGATAANDADTEEDE